MGPREKIYDPAASATTPEVAHLARHGMVATSHPLASQAGLRILMDGGNAVDAAVAVAATLGVVEPCMNGPAGAGYMLIFRAQDHKTYCLDFVGRSPAAIDPARESPPTLIDGAAAPLVPGNVGGWLTALERFGTLPRARVLAPAIAYAAEGFPVTPKLAAWFERSAARLAKCPFAREIYLRDGHPPAAGTLLRQEALAQTYHQIAQDGADTFYRGPLAERILAYVRANDGKLSASDLANFRPEWQEPLAIHYRGWAVLVPPPPCAGVQILQTLNLLKGVDLSRLGHASPDYLHLLVESIKIARRDRIAHAVGATAADLQHLLSEERAREQRLAIDPRHASPAEGDRYAPSAFTTHFCVADGEGNLVSSTQSLGQLFGAAAVAGDTGVLLNDFLWWFDPQPESPNALGPGKKVEMCLSPALAVRDDGTVLAIGTPGSNGITQSIPQMLVNIVDFRMTPQQAVASPRLLSLGRHSFIDPWGPEREPTLIALEDRISEATRRALIERGHVIELLGDWSHTVGAGAAILRRPDGLLEGGADPRRDGQVAAW